MNRSRIMAILGSFLVFAAALLMGYRVERARIIRRIDQLEQTLTSGMTLPDATDRAAVQAILETYRIPAGSDPLNLLQEKLRDLELDRTVMDVMPAEPVRDGSIWGLPVRLRLSPVPGNRLSSILNHIETDAPRFMIRSTHITRIRGDADRLDMSLELLVFEDIESSDFSRSYP
ncbi:hypothetical protein JXA80_06375 [bacterium]|nr:hypothetical protein [candidate division CSSED10-310 bacterium]